MQTSTLNPCSNIEQGTLDLLRDVAKMQMGLGLDYDSTFMEKARNKAEERYEKAKEERQRLQQHIDNLRAVQAADDETEHIHAELEDIEQQLEELSGEQKGVSRRDYDSVLDDLEKQGLPKERYVGELYFQAHRGTYTSQAKTKRGNSRSSA